MTPSGELRPRTGPTRAYRPREMACEARLGKVGGGGGGVGGSLTLGGVWIRLRRAGPVRPEPPLLTSSGPEQESAYGARTNLGSRPNA